MSLVTAAELILATSVADDGTFTCAYPTGTVQADYTSANASATAVIILNDNDRLTEAADDFDISYGASYATITQKTGATLAAGTRVLVGFAHIDDSAVVSQSAAITAITDNGGGTGSDTLAAGAGRYYLSFPHTFIGGTSAVEPVTAMTLGHKFKIVSWQFVTEVALVGSSGSRVANMEIGTTDVGTTPSTCTIPIANTAVGTVTAGTTVTGANTGSASDTFSIEIASGGTAFSAGSGTFQVLIQNMDTSDALSTLADKCTDILVGLRASDVIDT